MSRVLKAISLTKFMLFFTCFQFQFRIVKIEKKCVLGFGNTFKNSCHIFKDAIDEYSNY